MGIEHIQNILALDNCVVTAVADPEPNSLLWAQEAVGADTPLATFRTAEDLIAADLCDALVIASPNHTHHDVLIPCIASGLHLLIEKPLCATLNDCREVVDLVADRPASQVIWMGLEYRYMPPLQRVMSEIEKGTVGDVKMVAIREHRFPFLIKVGNWNRFSKNTGGTLVEKCCHFFDLMIEVTQSRPLRVYASGAQSVNHLDEVYDSEQSDILDNAYVIVDFANGSRGLLDLCMFAEASKNERDCRHRNRRQGRGLRYREHRPYRRPDRRRHQRRERRDRGEGRRQFDQAPGAAPRCELPGARRLRSGDPCW